MFIVLNGKRRLQMYNIKEMTDDELSDLYIKMCNAMADDEDLFLDEYAADFEAVEKEMSNRNLL